MKRSIKQSEELIPRGPFDSTLHFLRRPYDFVNTVCSRTGGNMFETRLLLRRTVCLRGEAAAEMFYDKARMSRDGAMPEPVRATLTGKGGVQGLDGERHLRRKEMFVSLLTQERVEALGEKFEKMWLAQLPAWTRESQVIFYEALHPILAEAVCDWAGVPLPAEERIKRTRDLVLLFDRAAALGLGHFRARRARSRSEAWLARVIKDARDRRLVPPAESALAVIAAHRDEDGALLSPRIAAVELLNVLRPTVATSVYITLLAHALHSFPDVAPTPASDRSELGRFVQEVRRFYPFFPAVAARSRKDFRWRNVRFPAGRRFLLDLHATNTDPHLWNEPEIVNPDRFRKEDFSAFALIPQGGGDVSKNHRCPGETVVLEVMERSLRMLLCEMEYRLADNESGSEAGQRRTITSEEFLMDAQEAHFGQIIARALHGTPIRAKLVDRNTAFEGYSWYDELRELSDPTFIVHADGTIHTVDAIAADPPLPAISAAQEIHLEYAIKEQGCSTAQRERVKADIVLTFPDGCCSDGIEDVTIAYVSSDSHSI